MMNALPPTSPVNHEGFWHCQHCSKAVTPSTEDITRAENAPLFSSAMLKCPFCHKHTVSFKFPQPVKPRKVPAAAKIKASVERVATNPAIAGDWFRKMRAATQS
jgi:hypothetical protein